MHLITARNAHQALPQICAALQNLGYKCAENIIRLPMPLGLLLQKPTERVLFWEEWNDNTDPFKEYIDALCSLSSKEFVFADFDGPHFDEAVLKGAIDGLRKGSGFLPVTTGNDPVSGFMSIFFQRGDCGELNMMISNSSITLVPDTIRFSLMQEYVAAGVGCAVGSLWWIVMDVHADLAKHSKFLRGMASYMPTYRNRDQYQNNEVKPTRLVSIPFNRFKRELATFIQTNGQGTFTDPTFTAGAMPMLKAYLACKSKNYSTARHYLEKCTAQDWQSACLKWISRKEQE